MTRYLIAVADLQVRCARCRCRIDRGDSYRIVMVTGGFDYLHLDCTRTEFKGALERNKQDPARPLKVQGA